MKQFLTAVFCLFVLSLSAQEAKFQKFYKVNKENGTLKTIGFQSVLGKHPRNFSLSPNEDFLLVANRDTDNIISFKRDSLTGKLAFVSEVSAPSPVCILF